MDNYTYTETTSCPLCGYTENEPIIMEDIQLKGRYFTLGVNECISCSLCYISPHLNVEGLSLLYNEEYLEHTVSGIYNVSENVSEKEYFQFIKYLNKEFPTGGSVLDIGCGVGLMLDAINKNCTIPKTGTNCGFMKKKLARSFANLRFFSFLEKRNLCPCEV